MFAKLLSFVKKPTLKHVLINTLGNYLNVFFYAFFAWLLVRIMTPAEYGVLSVLLGIAYVLANLLDFGTTATIYSYLPGMLEKKDAGIYRFIKSTFFYQSLFSLVVIAVLLISFPFLDKIFFKTHAPPFWLYITAISVLFFIWQNFILNILFAAKKFLRANIYLNLANFMKTGVILFMILTKTVTAGSIIFVFGIIGPLLFFIYLFFEKKDLLFVFIKTQVKREEFRFGYTLTYFFASQFYTLGLRMDLFLLSHLITKTEVGYYGLSQKIILSVMTTIVSITQVLSPGFSKIDSQKEARSQLKTGFMYLIIPSILFSILFFLPNKIYDIFFTENFSQTAPITKSLSLPFIIFSLGQLPYLFLLYTIKKPRYILIAGIIFFTIVSVGSYLLIPYFKVFGPPYAITVAVIISTIMLTIVSIKKYQGLPPSH